MRVIRVVVQVVAEMEALRKNESYGETQFTTQIVRKISLGCSYLVLFPVTHLMPYYAKTDCSRHLIVGLYYG